MQDQSQKVFLLKKVKIGDHKEILTFLGEKTGKVSVLSFIKSGKKTGQSLDYFNELEIEYREKNHDKLITLKNVSLHQSYPHLRQDYDVLQIAFNWLKYLNQSLKDRQELGNIYSLLQSYLKQLGQKDMNPWILDLHFLSKLFKELGFAINWTHCKSCSHDLLELAHSICFETDEGAFYCSQCKETPLKIFFRDYEALRNYQLTEHGHNKFSDLLKNFAQYHL